MEEESLLGQCSTVTYNFPQSKEWEILCGIVP